MCCTDVGMQIPNKRINVLLTWVASERQSMSNAIRSREGPAMASILTASNARTNKICMMSRISHISYFLYKIVSATSILPQISSTDDCFLQDVRSSLFNRISTYAHSGIILLGYRKVHEATLFEICITTSSLASSCSWASTAPYESHVAAVSWGSTAPPESHVFAVGVHFHDAAFSTSSDAAFWAPPDGTSSCPLIESAGPR